MGPFCVASDCMCYCVKHSQNAWHANARRVWSSIKYYVNYIKITANVMTWRKNIGANEGEHVIISIVEFTYFNYC